MQDRVVNRQFPYDPRPQRPVLDSRQANLFLAKPQMNLPHTAKLAEFAKNEGDRLANPQVRIDLNTIVPGFAVADRDGEEQLATLRFLAQGRERVFPQQRQLRLAHRSLRDGDILPRNSPLTF